MQYTVYIKIIYFMKLSKAESFSLSHNFEIIGKIKKLSDKIALKNL